MKEGSGAFWHRPEGRAFQEKRGEFCVLELFYPARCMLCGARMERRRPRLCTDCLRRSIGWDGVCRTLAPGLDCVAASLYSETAGAVHRFKFAGRRDYAPDMARLMAAAWLRQKRPRPDAVTWVPVSLLRGLLRGYDQSALLARELGRLLELPVRPMLRKRRHTPRQSRLPGDEARTRNVRGAYEARRVPPEVKRLLLVDDVVTSGATLREAARTLSGQTEEITALCFATRRVEGR
mgnify:CR=1 FL=1